LGRANTPDGGSPASLAGSSPSSPTPIHAPVNFELFNYLLTQMASIQEGSGTLLDNSLVLSISDFGNAATHDWDKSEPIPVILGGRLGGKILPGRHLAYNGRTTNDLLVSILQLFGFNDTTFGEKTLCKGALPGLAG
jgi:hypothetical protein